MQHLPCKEIPDYEDLQVAFERYPDLDIDSTVVFMNILKAGDEAFRASSETFKTHNISHGRFILMMNLFDKATGSSFGLSPAEIADRGCVSRATITGLLDGLEKDGIIERTPDLNDRRMIVVKLTQAGIDLLDRMMPEHLRMINKVMSVLDHTEKTQLLEILSKLNRWLGEIMPTDGNPISCDEV